MNFSPNEKEVCFIWIFLYSWNSLAHQCMYCKGTVVIREDWKILPPAWGVYMCDHSYGSVWPPNDARWTLLLDFLSSLIVEKEKSSQVKKKMPPSLFTLSVTLNRHSPRNKGSKLKCSKCTFSSWYIKKQFSWRLCLACCCRLWCVCDIFSLNSWGISMWGRPTSLQWTQVYEDAAEKDCVLRSRQT